jgi:hypothetical protein
VRRCALTRQTKNLVNLNPFLAACYKNLGHVEVAEAVGSISPIILAVSLAPVRSFTTAATPSLAIKFATHEVFSDPAAAGLKQGLLAQIYLGGRWT